MKVGRAALDPEAIRLIEEYNPEVEFDWTAILRGDMPDLAPPPVRAAAPRNLPPAPQAEPPDVPVPPVEEPATAAHARLGSEGVSRLRGRFAEVVATIDDRIHDPARREELRALAERLNPDTWVTEGEVQAGLEEYEAVFQSLTGIVGRRRRRRRRGGAPERRPEQADSANGEDPGAESGPATEAPDQGGSGGDPSDHPL